jgi:C4-dicarboxylate-specific signal transduction histidine kinase
VQIASCDALAAMVADTAAVEEYAQDIQDTIVLIDQQARRAAKIVKRLKQISAAAVASPKVATPLLEELSLIAQGHPDLDIQTECPPHLSLTLDRNALGTVLGELLDNARAHGGCAEGSAPILISAQEHAAQVTIRITDHGAGFSPEQAEHFFDPFFTSKQNQGHIGIGGYIAQNVARDGLAAALELQSAPGNTTLALHFAKA